MMHDLPWWAASQNKDLREKLGYTSRPNTANDYFSFGGLLRVRIMADGNMGGNYYRFFGFFENDPERYFHTFRKWDLDVPWDKLLSGLILKVGDRSWKVTELNEARKGFLFDFEIIQT
jgi:hypothetical protein